MRWILFRSTCLVLGLAAGCAERTGWPADWNGQVGKTITLEGTAVDAKLGALLVEGDHAIWIDGLDHWPRDLIGADGKGKRVRVTGLVIEKADLPAFVSKEGEPPKSGVPVESSKQLESASRRLLLKDAKWTAID